MFKSILVPATGAETDLPVFQSALAVAWQSGAHLKFLHVRIDVQQVLVSMASADMGGGGGYDDVIQSLDREGSTRQQKAEAAYQKFCTDAELAAAGVTTEWQSEIGDETVLLEEHGRVADLIVTGRRRDGEAALDVLESALMATGRPVLITGHKPLRVAGGTVAIAWKNTREAARAVDAAQPFIDAAQRVVILSIQENGSADDKSCDRLCAALRWRNASTVVRRADPGRHDAAAALLSEAAAVDADLLVMGGYSHGRLREMVLGGFTRHVLQEAELPVLMAH